MCARLQDFSSGEALTLECLYFVSQFLLTLHVRACRIFSSGEALTLECACKGELAMRHRACAIEWSNFKGDLMCDICKHQIRNLPPIDPAILAAREEALRQRQPNFNVSSQ